jgi:hypothetical protein
VQKPKHTVCVNTTIVGSQQSDHLDATVVMHESCASDVIVGSQQSDHLDATVVVQEPGASDVIVGSQQSGHLDATVVVQEPGASDVIVGSQQSDHLDAIDAMHEPGASDVIVGSQQSGHLDAIDAMHESAALDVIVGGRADARRDMDDVGRTVVANGASQVEEEISILHSEAAVAEGCNDRPIPRGRYSWHSDCFLQVPPCKLIVCEYLYGYIGRRATWHRIVQSLAACMCAYATYNLLSCWLTTKPSRHGVFSCWMVVISFVSLNSVEYSVLTHVSGTIRSQAIFLFAASYTVTFTTVSVMFVVSLTSRGTVCDRAEIVFGVVTAIASTIMRFAVPLFRRVSQLTGSSQCSRRVCMDTTQVVCLSILGIAFLVAGLSMHAYISLIQPVSAFAMIPSVVSTLLLCWIDAGIQSANPECVWGMWGCFVYVYSSILGLGLPSCFYHAGLITDEVRRDSTFAVVCLDIGLAMCSFCLISVYDSGYTRRTTLDYMYRY